MHLKRLEHKIMYRALSTNVTKHTAAVASHCEHNIAQPSDAVAVYPNQRSDRCIPQRHGRCLSHSAVQSLHTPATWSLSIQPATQSLHIPFAAPSPHAYRCRCCFLRHAHGQHMLQRRLHNHGSKRTWHAQFRVYWHLTRWRRSRSPRHPSYRHEFRLKRIVEPAVAGVSKLSANIYHERAAMQPIRVDIEADHPQYVSLLPHESGSQLQTKSNLRSTNDPRASQNRRLSRQLGCCAMQHAMATESRGRIRGAEPPQAPTECRDARRKKTTSMTRTRERATMHEGEQCNYWLGADRISFTEMAIEHGGVQLHCDSKRVQSLYIVSE